MQSRGEVLEFLKTFWFTFSGLFSYSCLYFDTAFSMDSLVYSVVIFLASLLAVFAIFAIVSIHSSRGVFVVGGLEICIYW